MATSGPDTAARRSLRAAVVLAAAATCAVGLVAVVHELTRPRIEAVQHAERVAKLTAVMGGIAYDNDPLADVVSVRDPELLGSAEPQVVHRVRRGGETIAVLVNVVAPDGYAGPIRLLVAVDAQGRLLGVRVLEHHETPGLGDGIEERRSGWIHGFVGRSLGDPPAARWQVRRDGGDFDQFTGATITPRAIVRAVRDALEYVARHREELFAAAPATAAAARGSGAP
jgi:electron transport complex protein RnfG